MATDTALVAVAFKKYDKMGEGSGPIGASAGSEPYVVTEKVHGANFCAIASFADEDIVTHFAKRTAIIGDARNGDDFYSCRSTGLLRALVPGIEGVLRQISAGDGRANGDVVLGAGVVTAVHVYGELFGGSYPHPDVPSTPGLEAVQAGIHYAPDLHFMAFDVAIELASGERSHLDFAVARATCEACGVLFAEPLFQGSLAECVDFPIKFETTLPSRLGLPPIPPATDGGATNWAEGVVIRPLREPAVRRGTACRAGKESTRGLFKVKIPEFSEKRYQNDQWKTSKAGGGGQAHGMSEEDLVGVEIAALVTEQRLANVLSKTGRVDPTDRSACRQLLGDFKEDVRDALEEGDAAALQLSEALQTTLDGLCREVITQELLRARRAVRQTGVASRKSGA